MKSHAELSEQRLLVIVVDDDRAVRNSLKFSLEIERFAVRTYSDGNELLNDTNLRASSCLLIDQNLPGMSGLEAIAKLRERHVFMPAILITSHARAAVIELAAKVAVPIVEKPLLGNGLIEQIRPALDRRGHHG